MYVSAPSRKTLRVLQPIANNQRLLVGGNGAIRLDKQEIVAVDNRKTKTNEKQDLTTENSNPNPSKLKIPRDNNRPRAKSQTPKGTEHVDKSTDTHGLLESNNAKASGGLDSVSSRELLKWMTESEPPENYWRTLAEQRRLALDETVKENEELYERIDTLVKENDSLKETNEALQEMAAQGERLAEILQELSDEN